MEQFLGPNYYLTEDRPPKSKLLGSQGSSQGAAAAGPGAGLAGILIRLPVLVLAWDEQGRLVAWNQEAERVLGYRAEEVLACEPVDLPEDIQDLGRVVRANWPQRSSPRVWEQQIKAKGGQMRVLHWSFPPISLSVPGWHCWVFGLPAPEGG